MLELSTKFVIVILAIGVLVGVATTATVISTGVKPSNLAQAQLQFPFQTQPQVQARVQQLPQQQLQPTGPATALVTTSANGGSGPKVSLTTSRVASPETTVQPGTSIAASATCPSGSVVTGGGFSPDLDTFPGLELLHSDGPVGNSWELAVHNSDTVAHGFVSSATCASIH
jgi:hypothetical protein